MSLPGIRFRPVASEGRHTRAVKLADTPIVSFDIFDTLVVRACAEPADVFEHVERRAVCEGLAAEDFAKARSAAEKRARELKSGEVTLGDIYAQLEGRFSAGDLERLRALECDCEVSLCVRNLPGKRLYDKALAAGSRVVYTSDMYLPSEIVRAILSSCGYTAELPLFLSCEAGRTKASGELFDFVAKSLGVARRDILHIGDNPRSDVLRPRMRGLRAKRLRGTSGGSRQEKAGLADAAAAVLATQHDGSDFLRDELGYSSLGPLLAGFCR